MAYPLRSLHHKHPFHRISTHPYTIYVPLSFIWGAETSRYFRRVVSKWCAGLRGCELSALTACTNSDLLPFCELSDGAAPHTTPHPFTPPCALLLRSADCCSADYYTTSRCLGTHRVSCDDSLKTTVRDHERHQADNSSAVTSLIAQHGGRQRPHSDEGGVERKD